MVGYVEQVFWLLATQSFWKGFDSKKKLGWAYAQWDVYSCVWVVYSACELYTLVRAEVISLSSSIESRMDSIFGYHQARVGRDSHGYRQVR